MAKAHFNKGSISIITEKDWEVEVMRKWAGKNFKASHITKDPQDSETRIYLDLVKGESK